MTRIAIAGFQHETNTFGVTQATYADFELADSWPGLLRGSEVIPGTDGSNLPLAGFVREARQDPSIELIPIVWCSAEPSSYVTDDAFERISSMILSGIRGAGRIGGVYLDLHGAMVTQSFQDGEGELLRRVRETVGNEVPFSISLDLHANLTRAMVDHASSITIFRTYPHLDMAETGGRSFHTLMHLIRGGKLFAGYRQAPFLVPLQAQFTGAAPCADLYAQVARVAPAPASWAELAMGFPAADIHDAGPAVLAYSDSADKAGEIADQMLEAFIAAEAAFDCNLFTANDAVARAMRLAADVTRPVVIADVQDNPGAGGTSDTTGLLRALVDGGAQAAVLGMLNDPEIAAQAHALGTGATFEAALGGKAGPMAEPFRGRFEVQALSDGRFAFTGEMYAGSMADTGPVALLRVLDDRSEVRVVVGSKRCQCLDQAVFTHIGVDPAQQKIIAVKSTVHFRADFQPIAAAIVNAEAPGVHPCRLSQVDYRNLRKGIRIEPGGKRN